MNQSFIEIKLAVPKTFSELFGNLLVENGANGYAIEEEKEGRTTLKGYLRKQIKPKALVERINCYVESLEKLHKKRLEVRVRFRKIKEEDWSRNWKRTFKPIQVTDRVIVKPAWVRKRFPGKLVIDILSKMAFGTGEHATTRLCLKALEKYLETGDRVLDLGTGSGILAIAAAKLGASYVLALDIDPDAISNARENLKRNKVQKAVDVKLGTLSAEISDDNFDLITANLTRTQIMKFFDGMNRILKKRGLFILSGIQALEKKEVQKFLLTKKVSLKEIMSEKDWVCFAGEKRSR